MWLCTRNNSKTGNYKNKKMNPKILKRKGITYQIDKGTEDDYIFYITEIKDITDEALLSRWLEYQNKDEVEDTISYINDGHFDHITKIITDIEKLKDKWSEHPEDFEAIVKYIID